MSESRMTCQHTLLTPLKTRLRILLPLMSTQLCGSRMQFFRAWFNGKHSPSPLRLYHSFWHSKRGLILNMGSFAGAVPSPMLATYSGTKAFLATFTSALAEEVAKDNITVEHINTYFVVRDNNYRLYCLVYAPFLVPGLQAFQNP